MSINYYYYDRRGNHCREISYTFERNSIVSKEIYYLYNTLRFMKCLKVQVQSRPVQTTEKDTKRDMMVFLRAIKDILSIKIKSRHDGFCDQFNRLFMTKMLLISSVIMGFDYFSDRVSCMVPKTSDLSKDFIHSACWISGFYIYKEMMKENRFDESAYYGIPRRVDNDGVTVNYFINGKQKLCQTEDKDGKKHDCSPMTRIYYLHYQWMPFYIGALAVFYYLPYILFRIVNTDLISLRDAVFSMTCADSIVKNYFNYKVNTRAQLRLRVWWNIWVKVLYVFVSAVAFLLTDHLLLERFKTYGKSFFDRTDNSGIIQNRRIPKAGVLLPSMGFCDIQEGYIDTKNTFHNKNRFICEISPHILYQYVLMVLWFFFVASIAISLFGFVIYVSSHCYNFLYSTSFCYSRESVYRHLTLREIEYLELIKKKSMIMYGDVFNRLKQQRYERYDKVIPPDYRESNGFISTSQQICFKGDSL